MDTGIGYLETVRGDLLDAGRRETRSRGRRPRGFRDRLSPRVLIAAAAAVTLLAAGTTGWFVTREDASDPSAARRALPAGPMPSPVSEQYSAFVGDEAAANLQSGEVPPDASSTFGQPGITRVIRTAELGVVIPRESFDDRFAEAAEAADANGGFVATSTTRERSGTLTVRVPAANFDETLRALRELGEIEVQTIQGRDVTADYVDLRARMRIAKARREVLLGLMEEATSIEQTIRVQNALDDTQLRIEELQGQLRFLDDRTSLATIRVQLREEGVEPSEDVDRPSIPNAFERSVAGFVGVIAGVVVGLGYVIPVALIALAAWFIVSRIRRRRAA